MGRTYSQLLATIKSLSRDVYHTCGIEVALDSRVDNVLHSAIPLQQASSLGYSVSSGGAGRWDHAKLEGARADETAFRTDKVGLGVRRHGND